jgi:hypothetical protein
LLGHWKNYDELESNLSLDELMTTLSAMRDKEKRDKEFLAAINGIEVTAKEEVTDITELSGKEAESEGFGIGQGIGVLQMEV